jgi:hypothetical protein
LESEEEGIIGGIAILVAADEVTGEGGSANFGSQVCSPCRMAGGGDKGTTTAAGFCLSPTGGAPREETPGEDNQDAIEDGKGGTDLTDVVEQGGGEEVGISLSRRLQALEDGERMRLFGGGHSAKETKEVGGQEGNEGCVGDGMPGTEEGEFELAGAVNEAREEGHAGSEYNMR